MGKMKERLIEDMARYPELYDGSADYEFWMQCRKEELLEKENKPTNKITRKGKLCQTKKKEK